MLLCSGNVAAAKYVLRPAADCLVAGCVLCLQELKQSLCLVVSSRTTLGA
jgi:hypothetical protein